jgi:hypothetical protein
MSEKGQFRKFMFVALKNNMEELRRLYDSDTPLLAYAFKRRTVESWTPEHSHPRGQLVALTQFMHDYAPWQMADEDGQLHSSTQRKMFF